MLYRFLLCTLFLSLVASAQPDEHANERPNENSKSESWSYGYGSDEGGSSSSYLGVDIADVTAERISALKLKEEHGAEITMVDQDAPAGKAGLHEHDVILSLNGTSIESAAQLRRMIKEIPPGRIVTIGLSRDGQPLTIKVQLADRHKEEAWQPGSHDFNIHIPPLPSLPDMDLPVTVVIAHTSMRSGLMLENITPQLGDFFGVKDGKGALIRSVEKGSHGEKAGFRAGDVVVRVNGQPVHDASDFTHALRGSAGATVNVTIMRDKHEQNITLTLPEKKDSGRLLEDSFEIPEFTEETQQILTLADRELASLDTEKLQQKLQQAQEKLESAGECLKERQEEMRDSSEDQQEKMREQQDKLREQQEEFREEQDRVREQQETLREQQEEMVHSGEELRQNVLHRWAEI
ncbi:MAG: PDZ domain-containing protein [Terriglobales bacterium]